MPTNLLVLLRRLGAPVSMAYEGTRLAMTKVIVLDDIYIDLFIKFIGP